MKNTEYSKSLVNNGGWVNEFEVVIIHGRISEPQRVLNDMRLLLDIELRARNCDYRNSNFKFSALGPVSHH